MLLQRNESSTLKKKSLRETNLGYQESHGLLTCRAWQLLFENFGVSESSWLLYIFADVIGAINELLSATALVTTWPQPCGPSSWQQRRAICVWQWDSPLCSTNTLKAWEREAEALSLAGLKELVLGFTGRDPVWDASVSECREPALVVVRSRSLPCWAPIALICTSPAGKSSRTVKMN